MPRVIRTIPNRILAYLLGAFVLLLLAQLVIVTELMLHHRPSAVLFTKFYFDREANFPTFFSSFILCFPAVLLAIIAALKHEGRDTFRKHWWG